LKICFIYDLYTTGGAAIAAERVIKSLGDRHTVYRICSEFNTFCKKSNFSLQPGRLVKTLEIFSNVLPSWLLHTLRDKSLNKQLRKILHEIKPEIINVHNIHSANWPVSLVQTALEFAPVSWTLHDCWSFSGGYYPKYCPKPTPKHSGSIQSFWKIQKSTSSKHPLGAITPSSWMGKEALSSHWSGHSVETVRNPTPDLFFQELDRSGCKKALGLPTDKAIVLCIAGNLEEERKGGKILHTILASTTQTKAHFLIIGNGLVTQNQENCTYLGLIKDQVTLQIAYNASDILLHPAPIDNLPNTIAESMCCGTPVLAFNTGGISDIVLPEKSGWLVSKIDTESLLNKLIFILKTDGFNNIRNSTKEMAYRFFNSQEISQKYITFFKQLLKTK
jgi:glycosyltransferase involved in cell wall biosynthesis